MGAADSGMRRGYGEMVFALVMFIGGLAGCSTEDSLGFNKCKTGENRACTCPSGDQGLQWCNMIGTDWYSCECGVEDIIACQPFCTGRECGDDGCGGSCAPGCSLGDTCHFGQCVSPCAPQCTGKQCGDDGCGGYCGTCQPNETCIQSQCIDESCVADCQDRECGSNGCGGTCGTCLMDQTCSEYGLCIDNNCIPDCLGKQCGPDGCGGTCGICDTGVPCNSGICTSQQNICETDPDYWACADEETLELCEDGVFQSKNCTDLCIQELNAESGVCGFSPDHGWDVCICSGGETDPCWDCLDQYCANEVNTCYDNSQCWSLLECASACQTQECANQCGSQYPGGYNDLMDMMDCMEASCLTPCS